MGAAAAMEARREVARMVVFMVKVGAWGLCDVVMEHRSCVVMRVWRVEVVVEG
jgi:hypothetical protein